MFEIQRAIGCVQIHFTHSRAGIPRGELPWRVIGIVVKVRDDNFIVGRPFPRQRAAQGEGERSHVGAKGNAIGIGRADKIRQCGMGRIQFGIAFTAGGEFTTVVGITMGEIITDGINHALRHLAAGRAVEKNCCPTIYLSRQGGKLGAAGGNLLGGETH